MRYAVLGSQGQLGRDLCPRLPGEVHALTRADANLEQPQAVRERLTALQPNVVINCAAYNFVDRAEQEPTNAFAINAWCVRELALICRDLDCTLLHCSTDYVFGLDATRQTPWQETDAPGPISVYGLSKLAGEYFVRSICPRHFVVRTCGLYGVWGSGGKGSNFVETMLRLVGEGKTLRVVADQICVPSYTVDVAAAIAQLLTTEAYGLYHVTNAGSCSWHQFAAEIFRLAGIRADLHAIPSSQYVLPARRPAYSVLGHGGLHKLGISSPRDWQPALAAYLEERQRRSARS